MLDAVAVIWTGCGHMAKLIAEVVRQSTVSGVHRAGLPKSISATPPCSLFDYAEWTPQGTGHVKQIALVSTASLHARA